MLTRLEDDCELTEQRILSIINGKPRGTWVESQTIAIHAAPRDATPYQVFQEILPEVDKLAESLCERGELERRDLYGSKTFYDYRVPEYASAQ